MDAPLKFLPYFKSMSWGGERITKFKNMTSNCRSIGESWELSAVEGCESIVAEGKHSGMTLTALSERYGERLLGKKVFRRYGSRFPLLLKFIDAHHDLSSFSDSMSKKCMRYVIDADKGSKICPDDIHCLPAGEPKGICAGDFMVEIQPSGIPDTDTCGNFDVRLEEITGSGCITNSCDSFMAIVCLSGEGYISSDINSTPVRQGETVLMPAGIDKFNVKGDTTFMTVTMPE